MKSSNLQAVVALRVEQNTVTRVGACHLGAEGFTATVSLGPRDEKSNYHGYDDTRNF